jgi:hypothetical protein
MFEQRNVENHLCIKVYCSVQPRPLAVDFDSSLVDRNPPRLRRRRVCNAVSQSMYPLENRLKRAIDAEET